MSSTKGAHTLEDQIAWTELSPSLQDRFLTIDTGKIFIDALENGINGQNFKIDTIKSVAYTDNDFRLAEIYSNEIKIKALDKDTTYIANKTTESDPSTQVIPNRIFLYDTISTNLYYYQDWDNMWCIRKDTSLQISNYEVGDIMKVGTDGNVVMDSNYRSLRMVKTYDELLRTMFNTQSDKSVFTNEDTAIYCVETNLIYQPKIYPLNRSDLTEYTIKSTNTKYAIPAFATAMLIEVADKNGSSTATVPLPQITANKNPRYLDKRVSNNVVYLEIIDSNGKRNSITTWDNASTFDAKTIIITSIKFRYGANPSFILPHWVLNFRNNTPDASYPISTNSISDMYDGNYTYINDILTGKYGKFMLDIYTVPNKKSTSYIENCLLDMTVDTALVKQYSATHNSFSYIKSGDGVHLSKDTSAAAAGLSTDRYVLTEVINGVDRTNSALSSKFSSLNLDLDVIIIISATTQNETGNFTYCLNEGFNISGNVNTAIPNRIWVRNPDTGKLMFYVYNKKAYAVKSKRIFI